MRAAQDFLTDDVARERSWARGAGLGRSAARSCSTFMTKEIV
jgi:hypothetical protein